MRNTNSIRGLDTLSRAFVQAPANVANFQTGRRGITKVVVNNTERLGTITSGTTSGVAFTAVLNPGIMTTGATSLLSQQAALYERYRFRKLKFHYKPFVSTATAGNIIIGADFQANDSAPPDAPSMTNLSASHAECNAWCPFSYEFPCNRAYTSGSEKLVRTSTTPLGSSTSLYDSGKLYVFAEGFTSATTLGYLDVEYELELVGVQRNVGLSSTVTPSGTAIVTFNGISTVAAGDYLTSVYAGGWTGVSPASTAAVTVTPSALTQATPGMSNYVSVSGNNVILQPGTYRVRLFSRMSTDTNAGAALVFLPATGTVGTASNIIASSSTATGAGFIDVINATYDTIFTLSTATSFAIGLQLVYSSAVTVGRTLNLITSDTVSLPAGQISYPSGIVIDVYTPV